MCEIDNSNVTWHNRFNVNTEPQILCYFNGSTISTTNFLTTTFAVTKSAVATAIGVTEVKL
ncbi:uncharacterized protein EAE97_005056 [Botrytis byssoidea]|uniref:Uncharacterized protein n=1 Tax=Botrytis byssoidea TaxID=139641 RepID=A0A9P5IUB1_9HELO|nr:uncharacterized protein EAE97_005056 [Botrytis byssoidea]KAF7946018.1 hypothetical protein EAE97_005056 [Botrytis byssoidea]